MYGEHVRLCVNSIAINLLSTQPSTSDPTCRLWIQRGIDAVETIVGLNQPLHLEHTAPIRYGGDVSMSSASSLIPRWLLLADAPVVPIPHPRADSNLLNQTTRRTHCHL